MIQYGDEEEEKAKEEYEKHKCKGCLWAKWQTPYIVSCLFPRCVKDRTDTVNRASE